MKRIGLYFVGDYSCKLMCEYSRLAERNGYESVWVAEDVGFRDAIVPLAAIAISTSKVKLATGILPVYYRSPTLATMTIATLDELSDHRVILGLGSGVRSYVEQQGLEFERPLTTLREYVEVVRQLLRGKSVTYEGNVHKLKETGLMFNLPRSSIPIYLAARQAKMFQLGGEIGDGILGCDGFCSERYVSWALENIQTGAKRAHRDPEKLDLAFPVLVSIAKSTDEAKENVKPAVISMFKEGAYEPHLRTMRLPESELGPLREALKKVDLRTAYKVVPDVLLEAAAIYGTPRECASKMKEFRNAGVDLPIVEPVGPDKQTIIRLASNW